jgi:DOPA 4,5-dioxygenase
MENAGRTIAGFHIHVYYNPSTREAASRVRDQLAERFDVELGRWREEPVGPHPQSMYQVKFAPGLFGQIVPWLMLNHAGLTVLVHPETGDDLADHGEHALWLGEKLSLNLDVLRRLQTTS